MTKNPSDTWFYNDWENDEKLKVCSLAAQGLWKRLLCIAARSPERGVVQIGSLNCSRTEGLPHIAAAVGHPPQEIAPLIDELVSSGAASVDRKGRIFNRRMVDAAKVSAARAQSGKIGADVTNEKRWGKVKLGRQTVGKPSASSSLQSPDLLSHGKIITDAPRTSASPDGPPRTGLTTEAEWTERLQAYDPGNPRKTWTSRWGSPPDAHGNGHLCPTHLVQWWKARRLEAQQGEAA